MLFGLNADEVFALKERGYNPMNQYHGNAELRHVLDSLSSGHFSQGDTELFRPIVDSLVHGDEHLRQRVLESGVDWHVTAEDRELVKGYYRDG